MTPKGKQYLAILAVLIVLMFVWIFLAVFLTGGREAYDFTPTDKKIMVGFLVVEIITVIMTFIFAVKCGVENRKRFSAPSIPPQTKTDKTIHRRGVLLTVCAGILAFGVTICGMITKPSLPADFIYLSPLVYIVCTGIVILLAFLNFLLRKWFLRRLQKQPVERVYHYILSHREAAEETAARKYAFLRNWKLFTLLYTIGLALLGFCMAFCVGVNWNDPSVGLFMLSGLVVTCAFSRVRFAMPESYFDDSKTYITEQDFPHLYALVNKAAAAVGCNQDIRIALLTDSNAAIAQIGNYYSVLLGVVLLKTLSEEEVFHILLHEFSHMEQKQKKTSQVDDYYHWLNTGKTPNPVSGITNLLFLFFDDVYSVEYSLYLYAVALQLETQADAEMARRGNPNVAGSALLKIHYYNLYEWEKGGSNEICLYEKPDLDKSLLTDEIHHFLEAMEKRQFAWNALLEKEILSRSASHPTTKMRLDSLGVKIGEALPFEGSPEYIKECDQALAYLEALLYEERLESYEENRKIYYLNPKTEVDIWEVAGKPVVAETYGDMAWNLRQLGRTDEAIALCCRAIETLPPEASHQAYFIRGCYRLQQYDIAGLEDVYRAIACNPNYIEEGLSIIGHFCCLTGNQEELDSYRENALALSQKSKDTYSHIGTLNKKDRLIPESLPEELHSGLLQQIESVDTGCIAKVFLVRKVISADFFTSAVVVQFKDDTEDEICGEIFHKLFHYLDTCSDWQFSLFDYRDVSQIKLERIQNSCIYMHKS